MSHTDRPKFGLTSAPLAFVLLGLCFLFLVFSFLQDFTHLWRAWQREEYSHGVLIPFLAFLMGWHRLTEVKPTVRPSWLGLVALLAGAGLALVGQLAAFEPPVHYGLWLSLLGLFLAFFGPNFTKVILPALIYLLFAIPLPKLIYVGLSQELQLLSSSLGVLPLKLLNIPVFQDGNVIDLGVYKLQVVEACGGLRYLFPLMSFGYLVGYLLDDRFWKRAVIFLSSIPLTLLMNSLRIALIGVTVDRWGIDMASGLLHDFEGWSLFLVCTALLLGETWLLLRLPPRGTFRHDYIGLAKGPILSGPYKLAAPGFAALSLCLLLTLSFQSGYLKERDEQKLDHPPFMLFPLTLGDWRGQTETMTPEILRELKLSDYSLSTYRKEGSPAAVNFYMAYYASQRIGTSAHSPSNCLPGGGWKIVERDVRTLSLPEGQALTFSRMLIKHDEDSQLVYFWFDERGRSLTEQYGAKWYLLWDSLSMHRTDGALIRLVTSLGKTESPEAGDQRLLEFLTLAYPQIRRFVPGATPLPPEDLTP